MSGINQREKKYAKKMRNQPSNVTFSSSDPGAGRSGIESIESQSDVNYREQQRGSHGGYCHRGQGSDRKHLQSVPKFLFAKDFAQYRAAEINAMLKAVAHKSNSQFLQSLPPHLRRRAMSDNVKRLPRRLREIAKKERFSTDGKDCPFEKEQSKSKSRKARRRHGNLLLEFNRRQRRNIWLETHIWHAKRFHMVKKWGYCLANKPTSKSYRACYRAMTQQCLLQDMSYYCCLELNGTQENLLKALAPLSSREAGPTFASVDCLSGKRQGSLVLYKAEQYPEKPLGPITFLWRPKADPENHSENRQLWIWAHPALKMDLLTELQLACQCSDDPLPEPAPTECNTSTQRGAGLKRKLQDKVGEEVVPKKKIIGNSTRDPSKPVSWTSLTTGIVIEDLTMEILRYRLIGPLSHSAILEVLQPAVVTENSEVTGARASPCWWSEYCRKSEDVALHNRQGDFLQLLSGIASPAEISTGSVLGLTVRDPRLNIPENRTAALPDPSQFKDLEKVKEFSLKGIPSECAQSQIWDRNIRNIVTETKISEQELNQMKSKLLVPGSQLNLGPWESKIPILLVQQPGKVAGKENIGWGSGWDILFPKGWGMAFWIPLIYRGVRVGGLQEGVKHSQYQGIPRFPDDFPDCPAGMRHSEVTEKELMDKYKRYPPAKRPNYIHYGTMSPFRCPWQQLVEEWEGKSKTTGVKPTVGGKESELKSEVQISNKKPVGANEGKTSKQSSDKEKTPEPEEEMEEDSENVVVLEPKIPSPKDIPAESGHVPILRSRKLLKQLSAWCRPTSSRGQQAKQSSGSLQVQMAADVVNSIKCSYPRFLVWARLSPLKKGCPIANATICIPSEEDLQLTASDSKNCAPQEPKHRDPFKRQIKTLKKKKKGALPEDLESGSGGQDLKPVSSCRKDLVLGLWPDQPRDVMSHCSRLAIGYVSQGDFSLNVGCGEALGFVSLLGLLHMLSNQPAEKRGLVLVRNPASLQYRLAKINIEV